MDYIAGLEKIKQEVNAHPLLEIVKFEIAQPIDEQTIQEVEQKLQIKLDEDLKEFYKQMNGCTIHWQLMRLSEEEYDEKVYEKFGRYEPDLEDDDENPFAQIKINPIEKCFLEDWFNYNNSYDYIFEFKNETYKECEFSKKLKILDEFSTFSCIAYIVEKRFENAPLVMLAGHFSDWWNSRLTNFASYWQMLIKSRGIYTIKNDILQAPNGSNSPPIKSLDNFEKELNPLLFK